MSNARAKASINSANRMYNKLSLKLQAQQLFKVVPDERKGTLVRLVLTDEGLVENKMVLSEVGKKPGGWGRLYTTIINTPIVNTQAMRDLPATFYALITQIVNEEPSYKGSEEREAQFYERFITTMKHLIPSTVEGSSAAAGTDSLIGGTKKRKRHGIKKRKRQGTKKVRRTRR